MRVLCHRGFWREKAERNTLASFVRAFESGFGAEIDVRDAGGTLVVSHDPPHSASLFLDSVLDAQRRVDQRLPVAFNIKSCGIASALSRTLEEFGIADYFVFDMAVPDALDYVRRGMPAFTRASEHELEPAFYPLARGIWLDCFESDWIDAGVVASHLKAGKDVALVSPELHGRPHLEVWERWAEIPRSSGRNIYLCTDHPEAARELFGSPEPT